MTPEPTSAGSFQFRGAAQSSSHPELILGHYTKLMGVDEGVNADCFSSPFTTVRYISTVQNSRVKP